MLKTYFMSKTVTRNFEKYGDKNQKQIQLIVLKNVILQKNKSSHCQRIIQIQYRMILIIVKMVQMIENCGNRIN